MKIESRSNTLMELVESPEGAAMTAIMERVGVKRLAKRGLWALLVCEEPGGPDWRGWETARSGVLFVGLN